jgi:mRNA interferase RelE/StbE
MSVKKKQEEDLDYELRFDEKVISYLEKLPKDISHRIFLKLDDSKKDPFRYFERLEGRTEYKLRVGNYRVIADILRKDIVIFVIEIGHRKNIYKK